MVFEPIHLAVSVPEVAPAAKWYISKLGFKVYKEFVVPQKRLAAQLLRKGNCELMLMKIDMSSYLPDYRKNTFSDLAVQSVKRMAFRADDLTLFIASLISEDVLVDVPPRLFKDKANKVAFKWAIIQDNNGNLIEFVEGL